MKTRVVVSHPVSTAPHTFFGRSEEGDGIIFRVDPRLTDSVFEALEWNKENQADAADVVMEVPDYMIQGRIF